VTQNFIATAAKVASGYNVFTHNASVENLSRLESRLPKPYLVPKRQRQSHRAASLLPYLLASECRPAGRVSDARSYNDRTEWCEQWVLVAVMKRVTQTGSI